MKTATRIPDYRVVVKAFEGAGVQRARGEVVDVSDWRNHVALEQSGFLKVLPAQTVNPVTGPNGRLFVDQAARERFAKP